jgi:hypothetical protein
MLLLLVRMNEEGVCVMVCAMYWPEVFCWAACVGF